MSTGLARVASCHALSFAACPGHRATHWRTGSSRVRRIHRFASAVVISRPASGCLRAGRHRCTCAMPHWCEVLERAVSRAQEHPIGAVPPRSNEQLQPTLSAFVATVCVLRSLPAGRASATPRVGDESDCMKLRSCSSDAAGRPIRRATASCGVVLPASTAATVSQIGISTSCRAARARMVSTELTPSAQAAVDDSSSARTHPWAMCFADAPVAAERAGAGRHQVAGAGEAEERERVAAEGGAEAGQLGEPSRRRARPWCSSRS